MNRHKKSLSRKLRRLVTVNAQPQFVFPSFLLPGEKIIFKTNPHWLYVVAPEVALVIFGAFIIKYLYLFLDEFNLKKWFLPFLVAAWTFVIIVVFHDWICIRYYLTNLRLVEERGIIGKRIMSIWLDKVQDVICKFSILGRIFGFGDIEVESAGTYGKIVFGFLPSPRKLREEIEKAILTFYQDYSGVQLGWRDRR